MMRHWGENQQEPHLRLLLIYLSYDPFQGGFHSNDFTKFTAGASEVPLRRTESEQVVNL
jgi:hypothetical protein